MAGDSNLRVVVGGRVDEPEPVTCQVDHCDVVVPEQGDMCEACELAFHDARDYERSLEAYDDGSDW